MPANAEDVYRRLSVLFLMTQAESPLLSETILSSARDILGSFNYSLLQSPVAGIALRYGEKSDDLAVVIFLRKTIDGFATFVSETLRLQQFLVEQLTTGEIRPTARPTMGGESIGEGAMRGKSGTFGCLVEDAVGEKFLLSCNHVLSNLNCGRKGIDAVWQPSSRDRGNPGDKIGVLHDFAPISLGGIAPNRIDAAIAKPNDSKDTLAGIKQLGPVNGTAPSIPYQLRVEKYGWKTKHTVGTFLYKTSFPQSYPGHGNALFIDQLGIVGTTGTFSNDGDSGSLVVNASHQAVGLIFADAPDINMTFANPIHEVFGYFGVSPV